MRKTTKILFLSVLCVALFSCSSSRDDKTDLQERLARWEGKEIKFPSDARFTIQGKDTVDFAVSDSTYKIVTYLDSIGCSSCKLNLAKWKELVAYVRDDMGMDVQFLFFFHPNDERELKIKMKYDDFTYPVCFDREDALNKLNRFPSDMQFQTFLLDPANRVVAVGNPVYNPKVKSLYLGILSPALKQEDLSETQVSVASTDIDFGTFQVGERRDTTIYIRNVGDKPLLALDVQASCGCTEVEYEQEPVRPGDSLSLHIVYEDNKRGFFRKRVLFHCNVEKSPLVFYVIGRAG